MKQLLIDKVKGTIKTKTFCESFRLVIAVSLFYALFVAVIFDKKDILTFAYSVEFINLVLKFSMWLFLGYATMQEFGRRYEYENIESSMKVADSKRLSELSEANSHDEKKRIEQAHTNAHLGPIGSLRLIGRDNKTAFYFYIIGVVLFFITSCLDVIVIK